MPLAAGFQDHRGRDGEFHFCSTPCCQGPVPPVPPWGPHGQKAGEGAGGAISRGSSAWGWGRTQAGQTRSRGAGPSGQGGVLEACLGPGGELPVQGLGIKGLTVPVRVPQGFTAWGVGHVGPVFSQGALRSLWAPRGTSVRKAQPGPQHGPTEPDSEDKTSPTPGSHAH